MKKFYSKKWISLFFVACLFIVKAQNDPVAKNLFINSDLQLSIDYWHIQMPNLTFHSAFRPYLSGSIAGSADSAVPFEHYQIRNFFLSKTFNDKPQKRNQYNFQIHPVINTVGAFDVLQNRLLSEAIGGANIKVNINNNFTFSGTAFGGNVTLPFYMDSAIRAYHVVPGLGQVYGNNKTGYKVFDYMGYFSYTPKNNKIFNFQLGRDRHFIGDGYRSMILSDYANPYPFFRINTHIWHVQYNVWYAYMDDITNANGLRSNFQKKFGAFHYLSWNVIKEFNIGVFENVMWQGTTSSQVRSYDINYLNPFIFYRPQEFSIGSPDKMFIGINMNARIAHTLKLYGQLGFDEFFLKEIRAHRGWWGNKQSWQLGFNYINALKVKGLNIQVEYNEARPYTYTDGIVAQNYAHYGLPLAHPLGANFREFLTIMNYRKNRFQLSIKAICAFVGKDTLGTKSNIGQNIFLSYITRPYDYGHYTTQGDKNQILQSDIKFTYWVIPNINARIELGYIQQSQSSRAGYLLQEPYIYFGFKTSFWNMYNN